jgi:hypothetical protein
MKFSPSGQNYPIGASEMTPQNGGETNCHFSLFAYSELVSRWRDHLAALGRHMKKLKLSKGTNDALPRHGHLERPTFRQQRTAAKSPQRSAFRSPKASDGANRAIGCEDPVIWRYRHNPPDGGPALRRAPLTRDAHALERGLFLNLEDSPWLSEFGLDVQGELANQTRAPAHA